MPTGSSNDSANPPPQPDPPSGGGWRHSWLPITWATAAVVLLGGSGVIVLLHEPGGRAQAQPTYCGLVTCAVLRSTAATSSVPAGAAHPTSPLASSRAPAPTATTAPTPKPAPAPRAGAGSTPKPAPPPRPAATPAPSRWPWPPWWPWWPYSGWGHDHGYPAAHSGRFSNWPGGGR
jgi:hypothetical protein